MVIFQGPTDTTPLCLKLQLYLANFIQIIIINIRFIDLYSITMFIFLINSNIINNDDNDKFIIMNLIIISLFIFSSDIFAALPHHYILPLVKI